MTLEAVDGTELLTRLGQLQEEIDAILKKLGPDINRLGLLKAESDLISDELTKRERSSVPNSNG